MRSSNPVLTRLADQSAYTYTGSRLMTLDDVVHRAAALFGVLLVAAGLTWAADPGPAVLLLAVVAQIGLGLWLAFSQALRPVAMLVMAAVEGVLVGAVSQAYADAFGGNVVPQAILGTLAAFAATLTVYKLGWVRATPRFRRTLLIAGLGYLIFGLVHLLGVAFNWWPSIYFGGGSSGLALLVSAAGVVLAAFYLVLDFDHIEQAIRRGAPTVYAWRCAYGLMLTLVWLYLEMLRLVAILQGRD